MYLKQPDDSFATYGAKAADRISNILKKSGDKLFGEYNNLPYSEETGINMKKREVLYNETVVCYFTYVSIIYYLLQEQILNAKDLSLIAAKYSCYFY